jgi:hypothetical protein
VAVRVLPVFRVNNTTAMDQKIKEAITVFFAVALLAFVAGAENYYSEVQSEIYLPQSRTSDKILQRKFNSLKFITSDSTSNRKTHPLYTSR